MAPENAPLKKQGEKVVYEELSDEELLQKSRAGESAATEFLLEKYKFIARGKAKLLHILGGDSDDLMQEAMIGLFKAIRDYRADRGTSFRTFANLCITRQLYSAVQASDRLKHRPLNQAISLDSSAAKDKGDSGEEISFLDVVQKTASPEEALIERENTDAMLEEIHTLLSPLENRVLDLYLEGRDYTEIAKKIGRKEKSIDNALQRIRTKVRQAFF